MGIREKIVALAILLMILSYLLVYNLTPRKQDENGMPPRIISESPSRKQEVRQEVFFPPLPKNPEEQQIIEETVHDGE